MENKRLIQILVLVVSELHNRPEDNDKKSGICSALYNLKDRDITRDEYAEVERFIKRKKPSSFQYSKFKDHKWRIDGAYWWAPIFKDHSTIQIRMSFLITLINELKAIENDITR